MSNDPPAGGAGHAVVIGGSMAGLLAARVLRDRFDRVTLVERDGLARGPLPRRPVPQGSHVHVLLVRGLMILDGLFPGLRDELVQRGAVVVNAGRGLAWHYGGRWRAPFEDDLSFISLTRPLLEAAIAERVRALPGLSVLEGSGVAGLLADGRQVAGVRLAGKGADGAPLAAELVVDASGRGSRMPRWLADAGFAPPRESRTAMRVAYASCLFPRPARPFPWQALLFGEPAARRAGSIFPVEGDRWLVTLAGFFDEATPEDHDSFLAFAQSLALPDLAMALRGLEPLSAVSRYTFAGAVRRHYEELGDPPDGLLVIGDAMCSFNPVYGQGMTVAALEAELLARSLKAATLAGRPPGSIARAWFREAARIVDFAWTAASLEDCLYPQLRGERGFGIALAQAYLDRVHRASHRNGRVTRQLYRVLNLLDPPGSLLRPRLIADILARGAGARRDVAR